MNDDDFEITRIFHLPMVIIDEDEED